ncbi:MAG: Ig-like domain-containing protein [Chloroflexota bacterium]
MRRITISLLSFIALLLLSVGMTTAQETAVPTLATGASSLQVVDSSPAGGEELAANAAITLYLDRPVDCASAQVAFHIDPQVAGSVACNDAEASLTFTPSSDYARGTSYRVSLAPTLKAQDGSTLADSYSLQLSTVGFLAVSQILPADGAQGIDSDSLITVIFNRPVVPLTVAEDASTLPQPLTFTPAVQGKGEWLNTSIYVFHPDPALQGGAKYVVTVSGNLKAVDGSVMEQPFSWSFTTAAPTVSEVVPNDNTTSVTLDSTVQVKFNQPMNRESVEASFSLHPANAAAQKVAGKFTWADDGAGFMFTPDANLALGTDYVAEFTGAAPTPEGGGTALSGQLKWGFSTVPLPGIVSTDPFDGQTDAYPDSGLTIYFASPMDPDSIKDHVSIEPNAIRDFDSYYSDYSNSYTLSFPSEPSTDYTIMISPGMKDAYGNEIKTPTVIHYTTQPYSPDLSLQTPGIIGFYNADNDKTQLFLTHRNVSQINLSLYSVPVDQFIFGVTNPSRYDPTGSIQLGQSNRLRAWSIPSVAPLNARRYELLNLGGTSAADCPGALESHLQVGDSAIVVSDPDPVRARASAPDGAVVDTLYKNYQLTITGGPLCSNGILWWEVLLREGKTAWVAEGVNDGSTNQRFLDLKSAGAQTPVALTQANGEALVPGIYLLSATTPETTASGITPSQHIMVVANANLTLKYSVDNLLVWATDVSSGEPIANAPIKIYDANLKVIADGSTDADGLLTVSIPRVTDLNQSIVAVLQNDKQFGIGLTDWSNGIEAWYFGQNPNYYPEQYRAYLYTDRPIYRPDQPVYFRGVVRQQNDVKYTPLSITSIPVRIVDDQGEVVYDKTLPLTPFGTFSDSFPVAADAPLGYYQIIAQMPGQSADNYYPSTGTVSFGVAEYRAPEYQVNVSADKPEVVQGDTIKITVDSKYFFGGSVANADVQYNVTAQPYGFSYTGNGYYSFSDVDVDEGPSANLNSGDGTVTSGEGKTDANGLLTISVPADLQDATQSQTFTIEATVTDQSDQAVSGRTSVIVHKGLNYIGVQPEEYVAQAGSETKVDLIAVDWESKAIANQALDVTVVERHWSSVQEKDAAGRTTWTYQVENLPVTTGDVTTDANGKAVFSFTPPNGGIFKITATMRDTQGNEILASNEVWVSSGEYVSWRQQNSNRIDLVADAQNYQVGDTAQILITSPFQGKTEALITVERGEVITKQRVTMDTNSYVFKLPITDDFAPNIFVSAVLVKGIDDKNPVAGFRMGLVALNVDNAHKQISIAITPDKTQAGPGDTVNYTVKTTDYKGDPVQAEVGISLTDLAVLTIADPNSGKLLDYFYGQQGLSVRTSTPLTINTDQITQTVLDTIKGGGGGFGEGGIFDIRQQFVDTPYWNASVTTNADGTATFSVKLPDNLTTWRLDARAVTKGDDGNLLVGQATADLLSTKPLLIRPVTPRFFVVGDQVTLGAVVNNNSKDDLSVDVSLQGEGLTFANDTPTSQTVSIPAGQSARVNWHATVEDAANIDLTFFANGGDNLTDASKPPLGQGSAKMLPVYKYEAPETVATGGLLRDAGSVTEAISLPRNMEVTQGTLLVELDPSLAATTLGGLDALKNDPNQSTEATVSRFLPNIMTYRALASLKLDNPTLKQQLDSNVNDALQRLYAQQKVDGGWGWFVQDESDPLTTAYALIGLSEAKAQGFTVSDTVLSGARDFLRTTFITPGLNIDSWRLNRQAFILYALARSGDPDVARTTTLYESRDLLAYYAKGFLAMALHAINPNDTSRTDVLLSDLVNGAALSATGAHWNEKDRDYWNWNTDTRTTAIVLETFITLKPDSDLIPNIVRYLMVERKGDAWETTQETAWSLLALTDWMVVSGELQPNYFYEARLNDTVAQGIASPESVGDSSQLRVQVGDMLNDQVNNLIISRDEGPGVLYYSAHLTVDLPVAEIQALNRGIIVERRYTLPGSDTPITSAQVGDNVQVRLTVIAPNDLHYVVIEAPIPAGADAVNPNLNTSQQIGTKPELNPADPLSQGWGWWYFSNIEFRDQKVVLSSSYLPAGTYEYVYTIRAGLAGTFNVIPATGSEFYFPEVYGRSAGSTFTIEDAGS